MNQLHVSYLQFSESTKFPDDPWPADIMFTDDFNSALVQFCNKTPEYTSLSPQDMCTYVKQLRSSFFRRHGVPTVVCNQIRTVVKCNT